MPEPSIRGAIDEVLSSQTLSREQKIARLRQFEANGIVVRTSYPEIPPRVEYRLTPLGEGLRAVLEAMGAWADTVPARADCARK